MFHILTRTTSLKLLPSLKNHPSCASLPFRFISTTSSSSSSKSKSESESEGNSFVASYLVRTCGLSPERAVSVSKHLSFKTSEKPDSVIEFFINQGFSKTAAFTVVRTVPLLLKADPQKTFQPKIDFFKSKGFSTSDILNIIASFPCILTRSLHNEIIPCFDFFSNMFQSKSSLMKAVTRGSGILCDLDRVLAPNMKLLREEGVPESHIVRFIGYFPRIIKANPKHFKEAVQQVKELGLDPLRLHFVVVLRVKIGTGRSAWARKEVIYGKWGWTDDDILRAFRVYPWIMTVSDNKLEAVMDFLVNKLGYTSSAVARYPVVLTMSLEKRIFPRGSVVLVLLSKGLVNNLSLSAIFKCNEKAFLAKFVSRHEKEAGELLKLYQAKMTLAR